MQWQKLYFSLVVLSFLIPSVSALGVVDSITQGGVSAFNAVLVSITDQAFAAVGINSTSAQTALVNLMVQPNDFLDNEFVQQEKSFSAAWYVIVYLIFALVGGILLLKNEATHDNDMGIGGASWRTTYFTVLIVAPLIWAFYLMSLKWVFSLEYVLSKSAFLELMDFIPVNSDNALAYFFLGLMRLINVLFFFIRYMVVGIIAAWFLFVISALFFPITKSYGKLVINYGLLMLFSRFVVVLIFLGGFGISNDFAVLSVNMRTVPFFIVLCLAVLFEAACILYPLIYVLAHSPVKYIKIK